MTVCSFTLLVLGIGIAVYLSARNGVYQLTKDYLWYGLIFALILEMGVTVTGTVSGIETIITWLQQLI